MKVEITESFVHPHDRLFISMLLAMCSTKSHFLYLFKYVLSVFTLVLLCGVALSRCNSGPQDAWHDQV